MKQTILRVGVPLRLLARRYKRAGYGVLVLDRDLPPLATVARARAEERSNARAQDERLCALVEGDLPSAEDFVCLRRALGLRGDLGREDEAFFRTVFQGWSVYFLWIRHEDLEMDQHAPTCRHYEPGRLYAEAEE